MVNAQRRQDAGALGDAVTAARLLLFSHSNISLQFALINDLRSPCCAAQRLAGAPLSRSFAQSQTDICRRRQKLSVSVKRSAQTHQHICQDTFIIPLFFSPLSSAKQKKISNQMWYSIALLTIVTIFTKSVEARYPCRPQSI